VESFDEGNIENLSIFPPVKFYTIWYNVCWLLSPSVSTYAVATAFSQANISYSWKFSRDKIFDDYLFPTFRE